MLMCNVCNWQLLQIVSGINVQHVYYTHLYPYYRFKLFLNYLKTGFVGERIISFSKLEILEKRLELI